MKETFEQLRDALSAIGSDEPVIRGLIVLGTGLIAILTLGLAVFRQRKPPADRVKVHVDAPANQDVSVTTRKTD